MKQIRQYIRLLLENNDDMIEHINGIIDDYKLSKDNMGPGHWNQLDDMIEDMFPGTKPPTMKVWSAAHPLNGEVFESYVTQEEAITAHIRDKSIVPANNDGAEVQTPEILDWDPTGYAYIMSWETK